MAYRSRSTRARSQLVLFAAVVVGASWMGCATSNGDPEAEQVEPGPTPTSTPKADAAPRPDFEAGFPDEEDAGGNVDPTPDGGDTCVDKNDPGSSESAAKALSDTDDGVDDATTITGVMNGSVDVDFYRVKVADTSGSLLQPDIKTQTLGVELCVFVKCPSGETDLKSCAGGAMKTSDIGTKGCCGAGPATISPDWNCPGLNDSGDLFFRVRPTGNACLPYTFSYVF